MHCRGLLNRLPKSMTACMQFTWPPRDAMAAYLAFGRAVDMGKLSFLCWSREGRYATPPGQEGEDSFQSTTVLLVANFQADA